MSMSSIENGLAVRSKDGVSITHATNIWGPISLTTASFHLATEVLDVSDAAVP